MKTRVAIIFGGPSAEHEVSISSAANVIQNLNPQKYDITPIKVTKKGLWSVGQEALEGERALINLKNEIDVFFNIIHGTYGEDGSLQALLEDHNVRFTGSKSSASKLGMDKVASFELYRKHGLLVSDFVTITKNGLSALVPTELDYPLVIKPNDSGSSVGVFIIYQKDDLIPLLKKTLNYSKKAIIQSYVKGREVTCGVLDLGSEVIALAPTEIIPQKSKFFDYKAKYVQGASIEITPARLPKRLIKKVQEQAILAHRATGCSGITRSDFILSNDGLLYILEINTIPGMTETSLIPQGALAVGIEMPRLLDLIIEAS